MSLLTLAFALTVDVCSRACGQGRDAHRVVVDHEDGDAWYTDDRYRTFHLL